MICEDSVLLREGLAHLLSAGGHTVVAAVGDASALHELVERERPDVVLVDVRLPPTFADEGLVAAVELRRNDPRLPVVVLSHHVEPDAARLLLRTGAAGVGYLLKDGVGRIDAFLGALEDVAGGGTVLDPSVVDRVLD
ncbi:MAG: response regulator, partial [Phycicoccus sp.]